MCFKSQMFKLSSRLKLSCVERNKEFIQPVFDTRRQSEAAEN